MCREQQAGASPPYLPHTGSKATGLEITCSQSALCNPASVGQTKPCSPRFSVGMAKRTPRSPLAPRLPKPVRLRSDHRTPPACTDCDSERPAMAVIILCRCIGCRPNASARRAAVNGTMIRNDRSDERVSHRRP